MKSTREWVAATVLMMGAATVGAQDGSAIRLAFNIPAQPLDTALTDFAQATGLQLLVLSDIAHERSAPYVSGSLTPEKALQALLEGSGLRYEFVNARTVAISAADDVVRTNASPVSSPEETAQNSGPTEQMLRLAQAEGDGQFAGARGVESERANKTAVPEVLVEGSRILNMDIQRSRDDAQPYVVFDREAIEKAGSQTLQDFLQTRLSSNALAGAPAQTTAGENRSRINLRGLGPTQTLILVDGHRVASFNGGALAQPDVNGIPLAAIERIEVLPTTASGAYGGSATGGVVNIILRRDYSGVETKLTYGDSFDGGGGSRRVDFSAGANLNDGRTNLLFTGSYSDANNLLAGDRDFLVKGRQRVLANNPDTYYADFAPPLGGTTNIVSIFGDPLTLRPEFGGGSVGSTITSVPVGYAGPGSDNGAGLISNAGVYNLDPANTAQGGAGLKQSLYTNPTVKSFGGSVQHQFGAGVRAFLDLSHAENSAKSLTNNTSALFFLDSGEAGNPFNEPIFVMTPSFGADGFARSDNSDTRAVGGFIVSLPHDWTTEMDYTWSKSHGESVGPATSLTDNANLAVSSGALNIFRDTNQFPVSFAPYLGFGTKTYPADSIMRDVSFRVAGLMPWGLPGGQPTATALLERRKDSLDDYRTQSSETSIDVAYARSQTVNSAYLETGLPFVSARNDITGLHSLNLTLSARWDDYSLQGANNVFYNPSTPPTAAPVHREDKFSSLDYTAALKYEPLRGLALRGSYGTGFLPPALNQLVPSAPVTLPAGIIFGARDPLRGNESLGLVTISGAGNPDLKPEQSKSASFGVVFEPRFAAGLRASIDWIRIQKHDNVTQFALNQRNINNEALLPGIITRGAPSGGYAVGPIVGFNSQFVNATRQTVEAYDVALDYRLEGVLGGTLSFGGVGTRTLTNEQELIPTLPGIQYAGSSGYAKWLANGTVTYELRNWTAAWSARYFDGYTINTNGTFVPELGSSAIESQLYHDISVRYRTGRDAPLSALANAEFQLAVVNVFNKTPPFDGFNPYYSGIGDPRLATYYLSVRKSLF
jgi:outer membrane receptor protein involved in Fe transport